MDIWLISLGQDEWGAHIISIYMNEKPPCGGFSLVPDLRALLLVYIFLMKNLTIHIREGLISPGGRAGSGQRMIDDATKSMIIDQLISLEMIMPSGPGIHFEEYEDTREWLESISYAQDKTLVIDLSKTDSEDVGRVNFTINSANLPNIKILPPNNQDQSIFLLADIRLDGKICQWIGEVFEKCPIWTIQADRGGTIEDLDIMTPETSYIQGNKDLMGYLEIKSLRLRPLKRLRFMQLGTLEDVPKDLELEALSSMGVINFEYASDLVFQDVFKTLAGGIASYVGNRIDVDLSKYDIRNGCVFDKVRCLDDTGKKLDKILVPVSLRNVYGIDVSLVPHGNLKAAIIDGYHRYKVNGIFLSRRNNEWFIRTSAE